MMNACLPSGLADPFSHKAEATDEKAETDESIVLSTIQAQFQVSQRSIAPCYFLVIMPFIVFSEILTACCIAGFHINRALLMQT